MMCFVPKNEHHTLTNCVKALLLVCIWTYFNNCLLGVRIQNFTHQVHWVHVPDARLLLEPIVQNGRGLAKDPIEVLCRADQVFATLPEGFVLQKRVYRRCGNGPRLLGSRSCLAGGDGAPAGWGSPILVSASDFF